MHALQFWIFFGAINSLLGLAFTTIHCEQENVTVQLYFNKSLTSPVPYSIATWFCWKNGTQLNSNKVVHLTIHGYSYDHTYWAFPYQSSNYSYVDYIIERSNGNIVVLNIDRLGIGLSEKPLLATDVTIESNANVIYQLTEKLARGEFQRISFTKIILVCHSLGTPIAWTIASNETYNQYISGLITTAWLHLGNLAQSAAFFGAYIPAQSDPKFSDQSVPIGYYTTNSSNNPRQILFYNSDNTDPNVINFDEQLKQTGTQAELASVAPTLLPAVTLNIPTRIPVLLVIGQLDVLFCDISNQTLSCNDSTAIKQREQSYYRDPIEVYVLEKSGHNINLHLNARDWYRQAFSWTHRYFFHEDDQELKVEL